MSLVAHTTSKLFTPSSLNVCVQQFYFLFFFLREQSNGLLWPSHDVDTAVFCILCKQKWNTITLKTMEQRSYISGVCVSVSVWLVVIGQSVNAFEMLPLPVCLFPTRPYGKFSFVWKVKLCNWVHFFLFFDYTAPKPFAQEKQWKFSKLKALSSLRSWKKRRRRRKHLNNYS